MDKRVYWVIAVMAMCNVVLAVLAVIAGMPAANESVAVARPEPQGLEVMKRARQERAA